MALLAARTELLDDLDGVITGLRRVATEGAVFGLVCVDDEFFVIIRPIPGGVALLLSDATAALDYDLAADVLDLLQVETPDDDEVDDDAVAGGRSGAAGRPRRARAGDAVDRRRRRDLYPDEQLAMIAHRAGFGDELQRVIDKL